MAGGRPTTYNPEFCEMIYSYLEQGFSVLAASAKCGFSKKTCYNWMDEHPEFLHAVKDGQAAAAAWWEERLMKIADGGDGNATAAIFGVKNRSRDEYQDKVVQEHTGAEGKDLNFTVNVLAKPSGD